MSRAAADAPRVEVRSRAELREWLAARHAEAGSVWLVHWRKGTAHHVPFGDLVSELLCWGWVDSVPRAVDAERSAHLISPRRPGSAWSAVNKAKVAEARASGAMTPAGEAAVAAAVASGTWTFLDDVERCEVPEDLAAALGGARAAWDAFPRSVRRGTLEWIKTAKGARTRARRVEGTARNAAAGRRPPPFER